MLLRQMFRFLVLISLSVAGSAVWAGCNFETQAFREELSTPSQIEHISVEITIGRKWFKNSFSIMASRQRNIDDRYKNKFNATLTVRYSFGECSYPARVRQSGDWKDHIRLVQGGSTLSSLDVRLLEGNVLNAVRFKLLLPETRNGLHEVLATLLLRKLGYIAPETFMVSADINGVAEILLFQENATKELLERNLRREGPIFEGDESVLWNVPGYAPFALEDISLARLTNGKWAEKGETSLAMALNAFETLQTGYLLYADKVTAGAAFRIQLTPNPMFERTDFDSFALLMIAMNGSHSLRPPNRKFYFNSFIQDFEPIYYDGNIDFLRSETSGAWDEVPGEKEHFLSHSDHRVIASLEAALVALQDDEQFRQDFMTRVGQQSDEALPLLTQGLGQTLTNLTALRGELQNPIPNTVPTVQHLLAIRAGFVERTRKYSIETDILELDEQSLAGRFTGRLIRADGDSSQLEISPSELLDVMTRNDYNNARTVLLPRLRDALDAQLRTVPFLGGEIVSSLGATATVDINSRTLVVTQDAPTDWVLVRGATIGDWTITFEGAPQNNALMNRQRFNEFGLTGCLNFYDVTFYGSRLLGAAGQCEDSINIVSSRGTLAEIAVHDGFADAVDIDFSQMEIQSLSVFKTGNDCFDVSTGDFQVVHAQLFGCGDKGISVGENSILVGNEITIDGAMIGVSSKDFSIVEIATLQGNNVTVCAEAFQKKQEFGGGSLTIDSYGCVGKIQRDAASSIVVNGLRQ